MLFVFFLLILGGIGLFIWYRFFRPKPNVEDIIQQYQLTPLEASIYRSLTHQYPSEPTAYLLYRLCMKPMAQATQQRLARAILPFFSPQDKAHANLQEILFPTPPISSEQLDRAYRDYRKREEEERKRQERPAPPSQQRDIRPLENSPFSGTTPPAVPPAGEPVRIIRLAPDAFDMFDFIDDLQFMRQLDAFAEFDRRMRGRRARHMYENQENVHALSSDCLAKAAQLVDRYQNELSKEAIDREISLLLLNAPVGKTEAIAAALERIQIDVTEYGYAAPFTLGQLLLSLVLFIKQEADPDTQIQLQTRLYEELEEASKKCGTGHVVRLLNVLQGFGTPYEMKLALDDEIYARLATLAQKEIEASPQMDAILEDNNTLVRFLQTKQADLTQALKEEYKEMVSSFEMEIHVRDALNRYTKTTEFTT